MIVGVKHIITTIEAKTPESVLMQAEERAEVDLKSKHFAALAG